MESEVKVDKAKNSDLAEFEEKLKEVSAHSNSVKGDIKRLRNTLLDNKTDTATTSEASPDAKAEQPKNRIIACNDRLTAINCNLTTISEVINDIKGIVG